MMMINGRDCGQSPCGALVRNTHHVQVHTIPCGQYLTASSDAGEEYERCKNHSENGTLTKVNSNKINCFCSGFLWTTRPPNNTLERYIILLPVSNKASTVTSARSLTRHYLFGQAPRRHCHGVEQRSPHTSAGLGILQGIERVCEEELSASFGTERPGRAPPPSQPEPGVGVL